MSEHLPPTIDPVAAERWQLGSPIGHTLPAPDEEAMTALAASTGGRLAWLDSGLPRFAPLPMGQALTQGQSRDLGPWLLLPLLPLALLLLVGFPRIQGPLWGLPADAFSARTGLSDTEFARRLQAEYNVTVLPGSFLAREAHGVNPGAGFVRIALVADLAECVEAARRIAAFAQQLSNNS